MTRPLSRAVFLHVGLAIAALAIGLQPTFAANPKKSSAPDFNQDIRPILSENCYACHGPDEKARKAKLRLDVKADALKPLKSGDFAIVPGAPEKSKLIDRVTTKDQDDVMPPVKTGKKLTPRQADQLRRWISAGADWPGHWAFQTPKRPEQPEVQDNRWARNPVDRFVLARLEEEGLKPSPEADKNTLIRRASLDLTGLPPSIEEVDAFLADKSPKAYDKLVDRLLESPRYGENMAKYWLDAARYADSHGYHIDSQRGIWPYRDWVVSAFNQNKPFDQFTVEQLAGDMLPNPTREQKIATGYLRCNMTTGEGGAIEAEYAAKYAFDRTETTGTIWLGLTMVCCRCHSHKYDPILHKEYYGLFAYFNNLDVPIMDGNRPNPEPFLKLPTPEEAARVEWLKQHISDGQAKVDAPDPTLDQAQAEWMRKWNLALASAWVSPPAASAKSLKEGGATLRSLDDHSILASGANPEQDLFELTFPLRAGPLSALRLETLPHESLPQKASGRGDDGRFQLSEVEAELVLPPGSDGKSPPPQQLKINRASADVSDKDAGADRAVDGKADTAWSLDAQSVAQPHTLVLMLEEPVQVSAEAQLRVRLHFDASKEKRALGHFRLSLGEGEKLASLMRPLKFEPWQVIGPFKTEGEQAGFTTAYPPEKEVDLKKTYPGVREDVSWSARGDLEDGKRHLLVDELHGVHGAYYFYRTVEVATPTKLELALHAEDLFKLWLNGEQVFQRQVKESTGEGPVRAVVTLKAGRNEILIKVVNHQGAAYFAFSKSLVDGDALPPDLTGILASTPEPSGDWSGRVRDHYRKHFSTEFHDLFENLAKWRQEEKDLDAAIPTTLVAKELEKPRETLLLKRGEYDKPGDKVTPGLPAVLVSEPESVPTNRLGLARWLVNPSQPLTARVIVNRYWEHYFGTGLVKTVEDFGVQGERPSHPALLDWLATEFMSSGWDVKHIQRLILTSATYRQSSQARPDAYGRDPDNRLLARGPRFRVDAEVLRDSLLYVGGLLVEKRGGPPVKPYEPPGLWEAVSYNNAQKYVPDAGEAQYRRSLYTYLKRQSPPPNMLIFDAPSREFCVARRARTNTPLQALDLLNDPQFVEASRALAQRMILEGGATATQRLAYGFRLATGRRPRSDELKVLAGVLNQELSEYKQNTAAAQQLLGVGQFKTRENLDCQDLAAWTTIASLMLNLDETLTKG